MATYKKPQGIPESLSKLLTEADARNNLPAGTMAALMKQEIGGNLEKYLGDPTTYHYPVNSMGKRVAPHSGKESSAFGPFGILDSTALKPGYGVTPMKDKSLEEQVRFASEYLAARSAKAGSLQAGLAGYGEGAKYADQVLARAGVGATPVSAPVANPPPMAPLPIPDIQIASNGVVPVPQAAQATQAPQVPAAGPVPLPAELVAYLESRNAPAQRPESQGPGNDAWQAFLQGMQGRQGVGGSGTVQAPSVRSVRPDDLAYGPQAYQPPIFTTMNPGRVDFSAFSGFGGRRQQGRA